LALSKELNNSINERLETIDDSVDNFDVSTIQEKVFKKLRLFLIKELDLDKDGNIKRTSKNLKVVKRMKITNDIILNSDYIKKVKDYINSFDTVRSQSDEYIKLL
jgi:hypothetical protein